MSIDTNGVHSANGVLPPLGRTFDKSSDHDPESDPDHDPDREVSPSGTTPTASATSETTVSIDTTKYSLGGDGRAAREGAAVQLELNERRGTRFARRPTVKAAKTAHSAEMATTLSSEATKKVKAAAKKERVASKYLSRRRKADSVTYYLAVLLFLGGDCTGVALPLIAYGEIPVLAMMQSTGAAAAMIVSGWAGRVVKDHHHARALLARRAEMGPAERRITDQLRGTDRFPLGVVLLAVGIAAVVPTGIGLIRYSVDASLIYALSFVLLALGTCLGSGIAAYVYADAAADHHANLVKDVKKAEKKAAKLRSNKAIATHAAAGSRAASITEELGHRGRASAHQVAASSHLPG